MYCTISIPSWRTAYAESRKSDGMVGGKSTRDPTVKPKSGGPRRNIFVDRWKPHFLVLLFLLQQVNLQRRPSPTAPKARDVPRRQHRCTVLRLLKRGPFAGKKRKRHSSLACYYCCPVACGGDAKPLSGAAASNRVVTAGQVRVVHGLSLIHI